MTNLPDALIKAYENAHYRVDTDPPFVLLIDTFSPELQTLLQSTGHSTAAYLTAWNPHSRLTTDEDNHTAHNRLLAILATTALPTIPGRGLDPRGLWPGEDSILTLGLSLPDAQSLAHQFHQNALVFSGPDATPRLILLH